MTANADGMSRAVEAKSMSGLVPWYLMASLLYYHMDAPILSDARYDEIAKTLLDNWADITHEHKAFITEDSLSAGSLFDLALENYPHRTRAAAMAVARNIVRLTDGQIERLLRTDFVPPDRLKNDPAYIYGTGMTWQAHQEAAQKEVAERLARLNAAPVRTRARPQPAPAAASTAPLPEVRVRSRVRPTNG